MGITTETLGQLGTDIAAMRAELRSTGADDRALSLATEQLLRQRLTGGREWKYLCGACGDYGLEMAYCPGDRTCGRDKQHLPHEFGRPCWCSAGAKFRKVERNPDVDFQQAGKTAKPKKFSRFGN